MATRRPRGEMELRGYPAQHIAAGPVSFTPRPFIFRVNGARICVFASCATVAIREADDLVGPRVWRTVVGEENLFEAVEDGRPGR